MIWTASSEFGTYRICEQRRFRRACAFAQSRQNLRCSFIQAVSQEEPSDGKPDLWPLWMAGHAQLKFVMTECSKTQIRLTGLNFMLVTLTAHARYCFRCTVCILSFLYESFFYNCLPSFFFWCHGTWCDLRVWLFNIRTYHIGSLWTDISCG